MDGVKSPQNAKPPVEPQDEMSEEFRRLVFAEDEPLPEHSIDAAIDALNRRVNQLVYHSAPPPQPVSSAAQDKSNQLVELQLQLNALNNRFKSILHDAASSKGVKH